jgi:hypothetical protein
MKKIYLVAFIVVIVLSGVYAQNIPTTGPNTSIRFEDALAIKGKLYVKEFFPIPTDFDFSFKAEIGRLFFPETGHRVYALKLTTDYYKSKIDSGKTTVILDESEIKSVIDSINYMKNFMEKLKGNEPYTEVIYKSSGNFTFGFYAASDERKYFIDVNNKETRFYYEERLGEIEQFFFSVVDKVAELKETM